MYVYQVPLGSFHLSLLNAWIGSQYIKIGYFMWLHLNFVAIFIKI